MPNIRILKKYQNETELLDALRAGEHIALEQIFHEYYNVMFLTAKNIVVDGNKAKDILQEVFEQLWVKRASLKITVGLKPYLSRAVANRSINEYKRLRKRNVTSEFEDQEDANDMHANLELKELNIEIQNAVESLPEKCRAVFIKSRFEGKSHQEIADELQISKKTIENQITKALKKMREALENYNRLITCFVLIASLTRGLY